MLTLFYKCDWGRSVHWIKRDGRNKSRCKIIISFKMRLKKGSQISQGCLDVTLSRSIAGTLRASMSYKETACSLKMQTVGGQARTES